MDKNRPNTTSAHKTDHVDVLIVGGGMSGIGAACHLSDKCPDRDWLILEARENYGGTWDLFRYPGIRSDSDMYTFGYSFRPWENHEDIASADAIKAYLADIVTDYSLRDRTRFNHRIETVSWDSEQSLWTVSGHNALGSFTLTCCVLMGCTGYYRYDQGYLPRFKNAEAFKGELIHPQNWPDELDYKDKNVVVIGSGATAVTLVPAMAKTARKITMLQRSPSYIFSRPAADGIANFIKKIFPKRMAHTINRWKNALTGIMLFQLCKRFPERMADWFIGLSANKLGPDFDTDKHMRPNYKPWDQRLCLIPDDDLYNAVTSGAADIVTDHIEEFAPEGIALKSGGFIEADIIVAATGLEIQFLGGIEMRVDGKPIHSKDLTSYRGMMMSDVPNFVAVIGYTNAAWTLKSDLTNGYVCRLLNHMQAKGYRSFTAHLDDSEITKEPIMNLQSGYLMRADNILPSQGDRIPWRNHSNYLMDLMSIKYGRLNDGVLTFK